MEESVPDCNECLFGIKCFECKSMICFDTGDVVYEKDMNNTCAGFTDKDKFFIEASPIDGYIDDGKE